jgi:hypothetical protein
MVCTLRPPPSHAFPHPFTATPYSSPLPPPPPHFRLFPQNSKVVVLNDMTWATNYSHIMPANLVASPYATQYAGSAAQYGGGMGAQYGGGRPQGPSMGIYSA